MQRRHLLKTTAAGTAALLAGCAGFRGGWESVPYVGDTPPTFPEARTAAEARERATLALPGLSLAVDLRNSLRTWDTQVWFFVVPVVADPRNVYLQPAEPGHTRVSLRVQPQVSAAVLRFAQARLVAGGRSAAAVKASQFGQWDAEGRRVTSGGRWGDRPLPERFEIAAGGDGAFVSLDFPLERPDPQARDTVLELGAALVVDGMPPVPPIRFTPVRWREGYT